MQTIHFLILFPTKSLLLFYSSVVTGKQWTSLKVWIQVFQRNTCRSVKIGISQYDVHCSRRLSNRFLLFPSQSRLKIWIEDALPWHHWWLKLSSLTVIVLPEFKSDNLSNYNRAIFIAFVTVSYCKKVKGKKPDSKCPQISDIPVHCHISVL